jgi:hypothetical protein
MEESLCSDEGGIVDEAVATFYGGLNLFIVVCSKLVVVVLR